MIRRFHLTILLLAATETGVSTGCLGDRPLSGGGDGEGTTFSISTRALEPDDDAENPDNKITTLRVMSFRRPGGEIRTNQIYNVALHGKITHKTTTGTYDFVFLANEPVSLTPTLGGIRNRSELNSIAIAAADIDSDKNIPQLQEVENIEVQAEGSVRINGGAIITDWTLELVRLAARIDVSLTSDIDLEDVFTGLRLSNLPSAVPLFPQAYSGTPIERDAQYVRVFNVDGSHFADSEESSAVWSKEVVRLIVPANEDFSADGFGKGDRERAIVMTLLMRDRYNPSCTMGVDDQGNDPATLDFTLPRNNWLQAKGRIALPFILDIDTESWTEAVVNGDIPVFRILNVSEIDPQFVLGVSGDRLEVSFYSNQPDVSLAQGAWSNYFDTALDYNAVTGRGNVVFTLKNGLTPGNIEQKVVLSAGKGAPVKGGLQREITIRAKVE